MSREEELKRIFVKSERLIAKALKTEEGKKAIKDAIAMSIKPRFKTRPKD